MTDTLDAVRWVITTLKADPTLIGLVGARVYANIAPEGTQYPVIIVAKMAGVPEKAMGDYLVLWDELILVKAVSEGMDNTVPAAIMQRVITVLHRASGTVLACSVENEVPLAPEIDAGVVYQQCAHEFSILRS